MTPPDASCIWGRVIGSMIEQEKKMGADAEALGYGNIGGGPRFRRDLRLAVAIALTLAFFSPLSAKPSSGVEFHATAPGSHGVVPLTMGVRLPYAVAETCYGWSYRFGGNAIPSALEERLILPAPARYWGSNPATQVAPDRASAVTRVPVMGRIAFNQWCVAKDDPPGRYRIEIRRGGKLLAKRSFVLKRVKQGVQGL